MDRGSAEVFLLSIFSPDRRLGILPAVSFIAAAVRKPRQDLQGPGLLAIRTPIGWANPAPCVLAGLSASPNKPLRLPTVCRWWRVRLLRPLDGATSPVSPNKTIRAGPWRNDDRACDDYGSAGSYDNSATIDDASAVGTAMKTGAATACCMSCTETCDGTS